MIIILSSMFAQDIRCHVVPTNPEYQLSRTCWKYSVNISTMVRCIIHYNFYRILFYLLNHYCIYNLPRSYQKKQALKSYQAAQAYGPVNDRLKAFLQQRILLLSQEWGWTRDGISKKNEVGFALAIPLGAKCPQR